MCPNCFTSLAMALGGAGSAIALAAAGLGFRAVVATRRTANPSREENAS